MKSYTDLEQSKKLAEILPLESVDMYYMNGTKHVLVIPNYETDFFNLREDDIPCWSLVPLLNALPNKIHLNKETYYLNYDKKKVKYLGYMTWDGQKCITSKANNIIDSCYEMIIKLHEQKLL